MSCAAYSDAWHAFFTLFRKFWPDCAFPLTLITDDISREWLERIPCDVSLHPGRSWCQQLAEFTSASGLTLLALEDFWFTRQVDSVMVTRALRLLESEKVGAVRLYPCPGPDEDYGNDYSFGRVRKGTPYRVSCQITIWRNAFLNAIASQCNTPWEFEIKGTRIANDLQPEVLAFKRERTPWPVEYLCSAISRGRWSADAKRHADHHGIEVDWSRRRFA